MKKSTTNSYLIVFLLLLNISIIGCEEKNKYEKLPDYAAFIDVKDTAAGKQNLIEITKDTNSLIFFYKSDCPFCKQQLKYFISKYQYPKNFQLILASTTNTVDADLYEKEFNLNSFPKIKHIVDYDQLLWKYVRAQSVPYNLIINKNQEIIQQQSGILHMGTIENMIE